MDDDDNDAALAHQQELERRRQEEDVIDWTMRSMREMREANDKFFNDFYEWERTFNGNHSIRQRR